VPIGAAVFKDVDRLKSVDLCEEECFQRILELSFRRAFLTGLDDAEFHGPESNKIFDESVRPSVFFSLDCSVH
jgi:hypothetical protein